MGRGKRRDKKKGEDNVCIFERVFSTEKKRNKRNKKCLALLHSVLFDEAESVVQWTLRDFARGGYRDTILLVHMSFCLGIRCFTFKSATIELNINQHFSLAIRWKIRCNKTANGVICDVLN